MPAPRSLVSRAARPLAGRLVVPGDKSISHRALMLGAVAVGETVIRGLLEGEDVLRTAAAVRALGAEADRDAGGTWRVRGRGVGGLAEPDDVLDMGNAGTGARLMLGLLAPHPFTAILTGDASLRARPMGRVSGPLAAIGARFAGRSGNRLPLAITGTATPIPITYELPVASAQVKSAVLLAGLATAGVTTVIEPRRSRDHTELMLRHFGAAVRVEPRPGGGAVVALTGEPELVGRPVRVPADPSSAAFPLVAALVVPGSRLTVPGVTVNPLRAGLFETLAEMGADLSLDNRRDEAGEPVADLSVTHGPLKGVDVPPERAPSMIDEYPILAVAAAFAEGPTRMTGIGELRVKESDRLDAMARGLEACGVRVEAGADFLVVHGTGGRVAGGAMVASRLDHRLAMSFLVLGMGSAEPVAVDDGRPIDTSFPGFVALMNEAGAAIGEGLFCPGNPAPTPDPDPPSPRPARPATRG